jgi:hypothetical protein
MFEKRCVRPVEGLVKLLEFVEYLSRYESETLNAKVWANTFLLTCLVNYTTGGGGGEKKPKIKHTQKNKLKEIKMGCFFKNELN